MYSSSIRLGFIYFIYIPVKFAYKSAKLYVFLFNSIWIYIIYIYLFPFILFFVKNTSLISLISSLILNKSCTIFISDKLDKKIYICILYIPVKFVYKIDIYSFLIRFGFIYYIFHIYFLPFILFPV